MTKREAIVVMLRHYRDAQSTLNSRNGGRDSAGVQLMPLEWNDSFRELERCIAVMRRDRRQLWWHVRERYVDPCLVLRDLPVSRGRVVYPAFHEHDAGAPEVGAKLARVRCRRWSERVDERLVAKGLDWLLVEYRGSPSLTLDLVA